MKVEDNQINKAFYDYEEGECFADEFGSYYMKIRDTVVIDESKRIEFKAVNLENGCTCEFENALKVRPISAKVVIE